jgi:carbonic anhydrase/acetyltransferase-like protein (isoleucine patch superfamily)
MFYDLKDKKPKSSGENWVAPNATIIGDVILEKEYKYLVQCSFKR